MMILRILLGLVCLSLLNTSRAEAQLFRRQRFLPQQQYQLPQRYQPQQRQLPQPLPQQRQSPQLGAPQNGYQGQLTASQRTRPVYARRADGSVVRYYPNSAQQTAQSQQSQIRPAQIQRPQLRRAQVQQVRPVFNLPRGNAAVNGRSQGVVTVQGQLAPTPSPSLTQAQQLASNPTIGQQPEVTAEVAPVGISILNPPQVDIAVGSISAATTMPEATISSTQSASSIPVSNNATNPIPRGLSLSLDNDVSPVSADVDVEPTPVADTSVDSNGKRTFSVLETID